MSPENPFEKLTQLEIDPQVDELIAEGFKERQEQRSYFYAQKAISQNNFDFYREYAIGNQRKNKKPVSKLVFLFHMIL